jgi:hypothetical protein
MSKLLIDCAALRRRLVFIGICACVCAATFFVLQSCWAPPFGTALALSLQFEKKLEKVVSIGPVAYTNVRPNSESYFVTTYLAHPSDGYWVIKPKENRLDIRYVGNISGQMGLGAYYTSEPNNWGDLNAVQGLSPTVAFNTSVLSPDVGRGLIIFGSGEVRNQSESPVIRAIGLSAGLTNWSTFDGVLASVDSSLIGLVGSSKLDAIGGSIYCIDDMYDTNSCRCILLAGMINNVYTLIANYDTQLDHTDAINGYIKVILDSANQLNYPVSYPHLLPGALYYFDGNYHYIIGTSKDNGQVLGYRWHVFSMNTTPESIHFDCPITDVLHDYRLVARTDLTTRYYDCAGHFLFSLPTGSLRYIFELYENNRYYSYFSRVVCIADGKDEKKGRVRFDVFRYPTDELENLAE